MKKALTLAVVAVILFSYNIQATDGSPATQSGSKVIVKSVEIHSDFTGLVEIIPRTNVPPSEYPDFVRHGILKNSVLVIVGIKKQISLNNFSLEKMTYFNKVFRKLGFEFALRYDKSTKTLIVGYRESTLTLMAVF